MLSFFAYSFAIGGLIAACGPAVIHLLNRRRHRVVQWAAMDFLREAMQRNRRMIELRDILLLLLRTVCVLLFGLALARPYWANATRALGSGGALHAVIILDNSLSMGYERLDGSLLGEAKRKAADFIDQLPHGSRISVIPLCGSRNAFSRTPYRSPQDARDALDRIEVVDRSGSAAQAADLALEACKQSPEIPAKRVVFLGDQQVINWPADSVANQLQNLPEMQVVHLGPETPENAWIEDFRIQDGAADIETPTTFFVTIRYEGPSSRSNVQVTLEVDGVPAASRTVDLEPGQTRELQFPYRFEVPAEPGQPTFVAATVTIQPDSIEGDRLQSDNSKYLVVPVVAALPVVFIDELGPKEDAQRNSYGETFRLRRLLAPVTSRSEINRQLVQVRHTTIDRLDRTILEDTRLVVIAGVPSPESAVPLLREYVLQGGQLFIAAGGKFDPVAWNENAWMDGTGILPLPLLPNPVGQLPEEATDTLEPFQLDFASMGHDYFQLRDVVTEELRDLYQRPFFFKAVAVDTNPSLIEQVIADDAKRIAANRKLFEESDKQLREWSELEGRGVLTAEQEAQRQQVLANRAEIAPTWLLWGDASNPSESRFSPEAQARSESPRILANYTREKLPFVVERKLGNGSVLFVTSAVNSRGTDRDWNNVANENATLMFDRMLRAMLERTLPRRNLESVDQITIPVDSGDRRVDYQLTRPDGTRETLTVDALGADHYGVTIRNAMQAGTYLVAAHRVNPDAGSAEDVGQESKLWEVPLAVNGPPAESQLAALDATTIRERVGEANYRWVEQDETISLAGAEIRLENLWKILMFLVLVCLLAELVVLGWPHRARGERQS